MKLDWVDCVAGTRGDIISRSAGIYFKLLNNTNKRRFCYFNNCEKQHTKIP